MISTYRGGAIAASLAVAHGLSVRSVKRLVAAAGSAASACRHDACAQPRSQNPTLPCSKLPRPTLVPALVLLHDVHTLRRARGYAASVANYTDAIVRPKVANWVALVLLLLVFTGAGSLIALEHSSPTASGDVTTVETTQRTIGAKGETSSTTTTQKTTKPAAEPSLIERLSSPATVLLTKGLLLLALAFLFGAAAQRVLLGRYAIKIAGVEIPPVPEQAAEDIGKAAQELAEEPARITLRRGLGEGAATQEAADAMPENREPEEDVTVETPDSASGLVQLRLELERVIRSLATPPPSGHRGATAAYLASVLEARGVIPRELQKRLVAILQAGDQAAHGSAVPERVRRAAEQSGPYILQFLAQRRRIVAQQFEQHVLDTLEQEVPSATLQEDASLGSARFDALVTEGHSRVAVEIRSRIEPTSASEFRRIQDLVARLDETIPLVLVVAGTGLTEPQLTELQDPRRGRIYLVRWDEDHQRFGQIVRAALSHS
jgi:hypothetical protein